MSRRRTIKDLRRILPGFVKQVLGGEAVNVDKVPPKTGEYFLRGSYGGWQVMQKLNNGAHDVTQNLPARELYEKMQFALTMKWHADGERRRANG